MFGGRRGIIHRVRIALMDRRDHGQGRCLRWWRDMVEELKAEEEKSLYHEDHEGLEGRVRRGMG